MGTRAYSKRLGYAVIALSLCGAFPAAHAAAAARSSARTGTTAVYTYSSLTGPVHYRVFTPSGYRKGERVPLVVVIHGCNTNAEQMEASTAYDPIAEAHDFVVMYPDDDDAVHPLECWRWYDPSDWQRGEGDLATVVGMIHATTAARSIDPTRVYEIGMSAGALITSDLAAAYPHLFAAVGINAGGPYGLDTCLTGRGSPSDSANAAIREEGSQRRVMPFIAINGDKDNVVSPDCDAQAVQQWLRTDNLVVSGTQTKPLDLSPASDKAERVPGGRAYNVVSYTAPNGCPIAKHYLVHGMGHFWSGGASNPQYAGFTDPKGPSAAKASWAFFSQFRESSNPLRCHHR